MARLREGDGLLVLWYIALLVAVGSMSGCPVVPGGQDQNAAGAPGAPTGVTAVAQPGGVFQLTWSAPVDNGASSISGYRIESAPAGFTTTEPTTSHTTTALTLGTSYTFSIRAVNSDGTGPAGVSNAAVAGDVPAAVTNLTATAPSGRAVAAWTSANAHGHAITSYTIVASPGGKSLQVAGNQTTGTLTGLTKGTDYTLTVGAANDLGTGPGATSSTITANCSDTVHPSINAIDSASVEYGSLVQNTPEPSLYGYRGDNSDLRGWAKFSLATVPGWAQITSIALYMKVLDTGGSPAPVVEIWYSESDGWTRTMNGVGPQPADISRTQAVSAQSAVAAPASFQGFTLVVGGHDWSVDIADGFITLGVRNTVTPPVAGNSYGQYYSSDTVGNKPYIIVGACE